MEIWYVLAGVSAAFTALVHTFVGQKFIVRPLLAADDFHHVSRYTNFYCWHIVTIVLFSVAGMFFYAAKYLGAVELVWVATFFSLAFTMWSLMMIVWKKLKFTDFPQWALIAPTAILGLIGLMT